MIEHWFLEAEGKLETSLADCGRRWSLLESWPLGPEQG